MARKQSPADRPPTHHLVMRHNWRPAGDGGWELLPGMLRLAAHASAAEAEADRAAREARARRLVNPFLCGHLGMLTSMPEGIFGDLIADLGMQMPEARGEANRDWAGWWQQVPEAKRPPVWEALDRLRFYAVVPRPAYPVGYAIVHLHWDEDHSSSYCLHDEGGEVQRVRRSRRRAEQDAHERRGWRSNGDRCTWLPSWADPLDPEAVWRLWMSGGVGCDLVEIELVGLESPRKSARVHLVARRTWNTGKSHPNYIERVPVAAYADRDAAQARCQELEEEARRGFDVWPLFADYWDRKEHNAFFAAAARLGLPPAGKNRSDWWRRHRPVLPPEQRLELWRAVAAVPYEDEYDRPWVYIVAETTLAE